MTYKVYIYICVCMYAYIICIIMYYIIYIIIMYKNNLWVAAASLLKSSSEQLRLNEYLVKEQSAQTATRAVGMAYCLWMSFSISRVDDSYMLCCIKTVI